MWEILEGLLLDDLSDLQPHDYQLTFHLPDQNTIENLIKDFRSWSIDHQEFASNMKISHNDPNYPITSFEVIDEPLCR